MYEIIELGLNLRKPRAGGEFRGRSKNYVTVQQTKGLPRIVSMISTFTFRRVHPQNRLRASRIVGTLWDYQGTAQG